MARAFCVVLIAIVVSLIFWRCVFLGDAFVPASQARYLAPWSAHHPESDRPAWNPLHYDSVGQFHCWAEFSSRVLRSGRLPLWNPYQMCGTPFVGNSQSAIYYPLNVLRPLLGPARAAGWLAAIHLLIAAALTFAFLRRIGTSHHGALVGSITYAVSTWQIAWLHLPTFAAASCWLPGILLALRLVRDSGGPAPVVLLACLVAMSLLAGHLQITLYVIACAAFYCICLAARLRSFRASGLFLVRASVAIVFGLLLASPQILPAVELSGRSHRLGKPTPEGYAAYVAYAVHPAALATLAHPDVFGNPSSPEAPYLGFSRGGMYFNYAEGAMYVGILPLLLAAMGLSRLRSEAGFPAFVAAVALLVAVGTPLAMVLYYGVPGFSQSGSPGRILVLWSFAMAWLAGIGTDELCHEQPSPRNVVAAVGGVGLGLTATLIYADSAARAAAGEMGLQWPDLGRQLALGALAIACFILPATRHRLRTVVPSLLAIVTACDLLAHGATYNATSRPDQELKVTDTIQRLQTTLGHDRFTPLNANWSFMGPTATLPPNFGSMFGIRDIQGYDSLMPGQYKRWLRDMTGADPSPPEVGNMLFLRNANRNVLDACGVRVILSLSPLEGIGNGALTSDGVWMYTRDATAGRAEARDPSGRHIAVRWLDDTANTVRLEVPMPHGGTLRLADQRWPGWACVVDGHEVPIGSADGVFRSVTGAPGSRVFEFRYEPVTTRLGHYLMALAACGLAMLTGVGLTRKHWEGHRPR